MSHGKTLNLEVKAVHIEPLNPTDVEFTLFLLTCQRIEEATSLLPIIKSEYASSESSASLRVSSPLISIAGPIVTLLASPTINQNISDAALLFADYSMQGSDLPGDPEQLDYPARPLTPGEEIMRTYGHMRDQEVSR